MDQTSVNNNDVEEDSIEDIESYILSSSSSLTRSVPDSCHSTISDDLSVNWTKLITEDTQIAFFLSLLPKRVPGLHIHKNAKLAIYAEIDLIINLNDVYILVEAKRSITKQMTRKGRDQVNRYCQCFRALFPDSRIIGFLYSPLGPKLICDIGNRSAWDPFFQPLFDTINYRGYKRPKRWNRRTLQSQSGRRTYRLNKRGDLPMSDEKSSSTTGGSPTMVVDAGVHHSIRMRASKPSESPFSMNRIFRDDTTRDGDVKFLRMKFAEANRNHFAFPTGSVNCGTTQDAPLTHLMKEMKISVPSSDGFSKQEIVQTVPQSESDDFGV